MDSPLWESWSRARLLAQNMGIKMDTQLTVFTSPLIDGFILESLTYGENEKLQFNIIYKNIYFLLK